MTDDPWREFRVGADVVPATEAATDPWSVYRAPGLTTPRAPAELTAAPGDKYRAAAMADRERLISKGITPPGEDYTTRAGLGAGFGWGDEIVAGMRTPIEMYRRGTLDPREGYRYAKAQADLAGQALEENTSGVGGALAQVGGALVGGGPVLGGARAAAARIPFTAREIPAGVMQWGKNTLKAGGLGAVQGAGDAPDVAGIPSGMTMGGILGAGVGGVVAPVVAAGAGPAARLLQVNRLRDPEKIATEQIAKVARDAGVSSEQIMREVADANAAGQPYAVVDTLGKAGERKLAAMAKVPGAQRDLITEQITTRDLNMPVRTGAEVGRGLGAPGTSEAAREALIERARAEAAPLYRQAEQHPTWSNRLQDIIDDPIARQGLRHGVEIQRLEAVGQGRPFNPRDLMITDFDAAGDPIITGVPNVRTLHTLKVGLDRMIEGEVNPATGALNARGRALDQYRRGLLAEMDAINPTYAEARRVYGGPMRIAQATRVGETMPFAGRWEDTMRAFGDLPPTEQQGVRIGYANAVRDPLERTGNFPTILREKSQKGMNELEGLSLYQGPRRPDEPDQLRKFLDREERMQRVSKAALGGPQTAENLADMGAGPGGLETALGLAHAAATGNPLSIAGKAMGIARQIGMGENEAQRMAISRALLAREPDAVRAMAARIAEHERRRAEAEAVRASGFRSPFGAARP